MEVGAAFMFSAKERELEQLLQADVTWCQEYCRVVASRTKIVKGAPQPRDH